MCETYLREMNEEPGNIDVAALMREIRERVQRQARPLVFPEDGGAPQQPAASFELSRVRYSAIELRESMRRVNEMPPQPPTLRGRMGGVLVRILRRAMFWQTDQLRRFETAAVTALDEQARALETLWNDVRGLAEEVAALRDGLSRQQTRERHERERFEALLREETRAREALAGECRAALHRLERETLRRTDAGGANG